VPSVCYENRSGFNPACFSLPLPGASFGRFDGFGPTGTVRRALRFPDSPAATAAGPPRQENSVPAGFAVQKFSMLFD
jgi:hypothetical protein